MTDQEIIQRLLENREIDENGCWIWTRSCQHSGSDRKRLYGQTFYRGHNTRVHRLAAHVWLGFDLDSELCVLHTCDVTKCFNPDHLFIGTRADNSADMVDKGRQTTSHLLPFALDKRISDETRRRVRELLAEGWGIRATGRRFGISHTVVMTIRDEA